MPCPGARGLQALEDLGITLTVPSTTARHDSSSSSTSGKVVYVLGSDDPQDLLIQSGTSSTSSTSGTSSSRTGLKCPAGLMMLQGMAVLGPDGKRRVERFNKKAAAAAGGQEVPAGIGESIRFCMVCMRLMHCVAQVSCYSLTQSTVVSWHASDQGSCCICCKLLALRDYQGVEICSHSSQFLRHL